MFKRHHGPAQIISRDTRRAPDRASARLADGPLPCRICRTLMRTFTLNEAQTMLPVLEALLRRAIAANAKAVELEEEISALNQRIFLSGGMHVDVPAAARRRGEREIAIREAKDTLAEIDAIGVQVKDLDAGLLDFPTKIDGE